MLVIRSPIECKQCVRELAGLDCELAGLREEHRNAPDAYRVFAAGLEAKRRELAEALADFRRARDGRLPSVLYSRDPRTGKLLIWRNLVLLRLAARLDQSGLARRLGTTPSSVSSWEREGYERYTLRHLRRIADELGCDLDVAFIRRKRRAQREAAGS